MSKCKRLYVQTWIKSDFNRKPLVALKQSNKMAVTFIKLTVFFFLVDLAFTKTCDTLFGNPTQARNQDRIFAGKRISSELSPAFVPHGIFTIMGCLDSCLRFDHCVSFDFMQSSAPNGKICRIYDGNQHTVRLVPERDWIHFNVSSAYLRKVSWIVKLHLGKEQKTLTFE